MRALLPLLTLAGLGCSVSHGVRPVGEGNWAVTGSAGGPLTRLFGKPVPIPLSTVGVRYGLSDTVDLHGAVHVTSGLLLGTPGLDAGASWMFLAPEGARPALVVDGRLTGFLGPVNREGLAFRGYADASLLASWDLGAREHLVYAGAELLFNPYKLGREDEAWLDAHPASARWLGGPLVGARLMATERLGVALEAAWVNPWMDTEALTAWYYAPGHQGAFQLKLGLHYSFAGRSR